MTQEVIRISDGIVELQEVSEVKRTKLPEFMDALVAQRGFRTPILPAGCVHYAVSGRASVFTVEAAPAKRKVLYRPEVDDDPQEYHLPFPWTVFMVSFVERAMEFLRVFFTAGPLRSLDDMLCHAPIPNRYAADGSMCLGNFRYELTNHDPERIQAAIDFFWSSNFTHEVLESYQQCMPEAFRAGRHTVESPLDNWSGFSPRKIESVRWKPFKTFGEVVDLALKERR